MVYIAKILSSCTTLLKNQKWICWTLMDSVAPPRPPCKSLKTTRLGLCSSLPLTAVKMREHENQFRKGGIIINIYVLVANDSWTFFLNNKGKRPVLSCINKSEFTKAKMLEMIQHVFTPN